MRNLPTLAAVTTTLSAAFIAPAAHAQFISLGDSHKFIISNTEVARLTSSTRLGIGTQSPSTALEVSGTVSATSAIISSIGAGNIATSGNISATGYVRAGFTSTCNSTLTGILRTSGTSIEFCNGTNWVAMGGSSGVLPALAYVKCVWNGTTTSIARSYNVASCTRNSIGDYTITFSPALPDDTYTFLATAAGSYSSNIGVYVSRHKTTAQTASSLRVQTWYGYAAGALTDPQDFTIVVY